MNFKEFYNACEKDISSFIAFSNDNQKLSFAILCCHRMLPNYQYYLKMNSLEDDGFFTNIIKQAEEYLFKENDNIYHNGKFYLDEIMEVRNVDSSEDIYAMFASDTLCCFYDLVRFILENKSEYILGTGSSCFESVINFTQEKENINDIYVINYGERMLENIYMIKEIKTQRYHIDYIKKIKVMTKDDFLILKNHYEFPMLKLPIE